MRGARVVEAPGALPVETVRDLEPDTDTGAVVDGMNAFGFDLLRTLRADGTDNVVVSPYSIVSALGMVYAGARGDTADEMAEVLGYPDPPESAHAGLNALSLALARRERDGLELATANQIWARPNIEVRNEFVELLARHYGAPMAASDFRSEKVINSWVAERTKDRIPELFPAGSFTPETMMVLVNAIYLNAKWQRPFEPSMTAPGPFTRADGSTVQVPMMHNDRELPSAVNEDWIAVELAYAGDEMSMLVIVPRDLEEFERRLSPELLERDRRSHPGRGHPLLDAAHIAALPCCTARGAGGARDAHAVRCCRFQWHDGRWGTCSEPGRARGLHRDGRGRH